MIGLRLAPIAALVGALLVAVLALLAAPRAASAAEPAVGEPAARTRIVILPIVVHSAASNGAYVSRGIADMISSRLEQTGHVSVDRVDDPSAATTLLAKALEIGQVRGGDYLIYGAFTQFGDGASLDVHCVPLHVKDVAEAAAARRIFISSGEMGDIIPKLDEIVDRVAIFVNASGAAAEGGGAQAAGDARAGDDVRAADRAAADAALLRDLVRRLEALERAVDGGAAAGDNASPTAAQPPEEPPES